MSERVHGEKYDAKLSTPAIAAKVREEIKALVKSGELPRAKYSVRSESFAGGSAIRVRITEVAPFELVSSDWVLWTIWNNDPSGIRNPGGARNRHTPKAAALLKRIESMLAAYNHDGSDIQSDYFDVKFYASVDFDYREITEQEAAIRELPEALLRARSAAEQTQREAAEEIARAEYRAQQAAEEAEAEERRRLAIVVPAPFPVVGLFAWIHTPAKA